MIENFSIIQATLLIVAIINIILATVIFSRGLKNVADGTFGLIATSCVIWCLTIIGFYTTSSDFKINWVQFTHSSALFISLLFLIFAFYFPQKIIKNRSPIILSIIAFLAMLFLIFFTNIVIGGTVGKAYVIYTGYIMYSLLLMANFLVGFLFLIKQYRVATDKIQKIQVRYVLFGSMLASGLAIIPDLVLPYFGIFDYTWLGPLFTLIMVISLFFAMLKYGLFNIKIIITEIISVIIVVALIVELFFSRSITELIFKTIILMIVTIFSYLLIKGVYREVQQRERIEILAVDLQKANDRLTELDRQKSEFVSFATHQLRAPLTAMKGYASLILEGDMGELTDKTKEAVGRIYESTNTLASIVDDYLNITRIELGSMKYAFETIDMRQLVEDIIAEIKPNIQKTGLQFSFKAEGPGVDYRITADRDKLKQVIENLIDNSLKYTPKGSVEVSIGLNKALHKIVLQIKDTGVGIAPETMPRLFQKFSRADNANKTNIRGTGLGLFVAREIITAHHGEIKVESPGEGKGSTFSVVIEPFAKA